MNTPRVSVIMSVFNGLPYLRDATRSIQVQSFRDFEFLIVDDGSIDASADMLAELARGDARIRLLRQQNSGLAVALNLAIAESRGEYIARMDADDLSRPGRLAAQVAYLDAHPRCGVVGTGYVIIDASGNPMGGIQAKDDPPKLRQHIMSATGNPFCHGSVMMRASALRTLSPVYRWRYSQDFDLWVRLLTVWDAGMVASPLYLYREHSASIHGRKDLVALRLAQRRAMLDLMARGSVFDNDACQRAIDEIYGARNEPITPPARPSPADRHLAAIFFSGDFYALGRECRRLRDAGVRSRRLAMMQAMSALPAAIGHFGYDLAVGAANLFAPLQRRLFVGEINGQFQ